MPFEPLRFLHAANVFLGSPVHLPEECSNVIRDLAVHATRTAFHNVVRACLDYEVEFLLLCGNTFVEEHRSLAARVALCDGLSRLDDAGVRVFVLPGKHDPYDAWQTIPELPESVTVFAKDDEPVAVFRDGCVIASVGPISSSGTGPEHNAGREPGPVRIGLSNVNGDRHGLPHDGSEPTLPAASDEEALSPALTSSTFDFLGLGGTTRERTRHTSSGIIHHPGTTQPRLHTDGNGSCTLVEIDETQKFRLTAIPTAAVRFEHLKRTLDDGDTTQNLLQTLPGQLMQRPPVEAERLRCVLWTVNGRGSLWTALQSEEQRYRIEHELNVDPTDDSPLSVIHCFRFSPWEASDEISTDSLTTEFHKVISRISVTAPQDISRGMAELTALRPDGKSRFDPLSARMNPSHIITLAEHIGAQRLLETTAEGFEA